MNERVFVEMSREQALIAENACELYARLKLGQFREITWHMLNMKTDDSTFFWTRRDIANDLLELAAKYIYPPRNDGSGYVVSSAEKDEDFNRAWDVYTALRHARAWHDNPEDGKISWSVCYDDPTNESGDGVVKCEIKGDEMMT